MKEKVKFWLKLSIPLLAIIIGVGIYLKIKEDPKSSQQKDL